MRTVFKILAVFLCWVATGQFIFFLTHDTPDVMHYLNTASIEYFMAAIIYFLSVWLPPVNINDNRSFKIIFEDKKEKDTLN